MSSENQPTINDLYEADIGFVLELNQNGRNFGLELVEIDGEICILPGPELPGLYERFNKNTYPEEKFFTITERNLAPVAWDNDTPKLGYVPNKVSYPLWVNNKMSYFTNDNDFYVIEGTNEKTEAEKTAAGFFPEEIEDLPGDGFYSISKWKKIDWVNQHTNFTKWIRVIFKHSDDSVKLRQLWKLFWKSVYKREDKEERRAWLFNKHITVIKNTFHRFGIKPKSKSKQLELKL